MSVLNRYIKHAAIKQDGIVYVGKRHHNVIAIMIECGLPAPIRGVQGFVDNNGVFVDREEALKIAEAAGQIVKKHPPLYRLLSEDIY